MTYISGTIKCASLALAASGLLMAPNAIAHHSNAPHFDTSVEITITGIISDWKLVNPHAFLYFDVTDDDGTQTQWRCETAAASELKRRGYTSDTFKAGETITVIGNPARREENHCFFRDLVLDDGTKIDRNTDLSSLGRGNDSNTMATTAALTLTAKLLGDEPDITGYWWDGDNTDPSNTAPSGPPPGGGMGGMGVQADGSLPPRLARIAAIKLSPEAQPIQDKYERIYDDPTFHCRLSNIVESLGRDESINLIEQNGDTIRMVYGFMDYERTIYLNMDSHPETLTLTDGGHSIGYWDNNSLVVDTIGFTPSVFSQELGIPTSEGFHVEERFNFIEGTGEIERSYRVSDKLYWEDTYEGSDELRRSKDAYAPYDCQPLSGLNNIRPGTPEYEAELRKVEAVQSLASNDSVPAKTTNSGLSKLWLLALAILAAISGLALYRRFKQI